MFKLPALWWLHLGALVRSRLTLRRGAKQVAVDEELPVAIVDAGYMGNPNEWCWWDEEYPDEGSCGPYASRDDAVDSATDAGYRVENDEVDDAALRAIKGSA